MIEETKVVEVNQDSPIEQLALRALLDAGRTGRVRVIWQSGQERPDAR